MRVAMGAKEESEMRGPDGGVGPYGNRVAAALAVAAGWPSAHHMRTPRRAVPCRWAAAGGR